MQVDVVLESDRACEPYSCRDDKAAASCLRKHVYRLGECLRIEEHAVSDSAEVFYVHLANRDVRTLDLGHFERKVLVEMPEFVICTASEQSEARNE